jgi:hypothetical protein
MMKPNHELQMALVEAPYKINRLDDANGHLKICIDRIKADMAKPIKNQIAIAALCACSGDIRGNCMSRTDMYEFDAIVGRTMARFNEQTKPKPEQLKALMVFQQTPIEAPPF